MNATISHRGRKIFVTVNPCSWGYPGYGLSISIASKPGAAVVTDVNKKVAPMWMTKEAMLEEAKRQALRWLNANGVEKLDDQVAKRAKPLAEEEAEAKRLASLRKKGYTHILSAWIHPPHGDDYHVEAYFVGAPTKHQIRRILSKSVVKTDYTTKCITKKARRSAIAEST
jgi:hypothetical protein